MPLLRYEIGDYAEVGDPCPCGRGLPVLRRILGRKRNTCLLPDGSRRWPSLSADELSADLTSFPPIQQFQLVQRSLQSIELDMGDVAKVGSLGKILTNQAVRVLVRAALIRTARIGKV